MIDLAMMDRLVRPASLGKNVLAYKLQVLVIGSALAGIAGCFYAWQFYYFSPDDFQPLLTFFAWMIVILGGLGQHHGRVQSQLAQAVRDALAGSDLTRVRSAADDLERTMQRVGQEAYSQSGTPASDGTAGEASGREPGTVEGEYREV